ncbi:XRE family transcriptional regulator [Parashewanella spongiae]|uniref:XRE family transcriptional regulator n=1 Tax=Parashewanella spongiae TaxID=342950 RepID=A0A3A6TKP8_9GAMM|nr:helix-turn-helix transcriptional regulator [Parashewanella spongiae]MCL1078617.1 helix-turn-helix domain-containing protein [Parashewanella spongiae]RJY13020.1 XRE family transcriptional regulator [Parashewanella spongiae]
MSDPRQEFSEKLRSLRTKKNISQEKLAKLTKIDRSYMGRVDRGEVNLTFDTLLKIAKALECQPAELMPHIEYNKDKT